ncbi:hypothetical protein SK128_019855, partial [Halocaridina rubra]
KLFTASEDRKPLDLMKICEILRNSNQKSDTDWSGDVRSDEDVSICSGCHQRGICVCLSQAKTDFDQSNKKINFKLESRLLKDQQENTISSPHSKLIKNIMGMSFLSDSKASKSDLISNNYNDAVSDIMDQFFVRKESFGEIGIANSSTTEPLHLISDGNPMRPSKGTVYPTSVYHLLIRFLDPDPEARITAEEALRHPFFKSPLP